MQYETAFHNAFIVERCQQLPNSDFPIDSASWSRPLSRSPWMKNKMHDVVLSTEV